MYYYIIMTFIVVIHILNSFLFLYLPFYYYPINIFFCRFFCVVLVALIFLFFKYVYVHLNFYFSFCYFSTSS